MKTQEFYWNIPIIPNFQSGLFFTSVEISGFECPYTERTLRRNRKIFGMAGFS